ncbi:MAG: hypothetical protein IKV86_02445 [Clostridia bacterium]|nr:hypothetical protein [Clostridia bacterium]
MYEEKCCIKTCCFDIVIAIVAAVITLAVGIIVGTLLSETFVSIVPALILFAVSMLIVFIVLLVLRRCRRGRDEGCFDR